MLLLFEDDDKGQREEKIEERVVIFLSVLTTAVGVTTLMLSTVQVADESRPWAASCVLVSALTMLVFSGDSVGDSSLLVEDSSNPITRSVTKLMMGAF